MSNFRNGIAALLVGAAAVVAVAEEEPAKHNLDLRRSQWKAGDTVTCTSSGTGKQRVDMVAPDGTKTMMQEGTEETRWTAVIKAVEVDEKGQRTKTHVHFEAYRVKSVGQNMMAGQTEPEETTDESLEGVTIEVSGGEWKEISEGAAISQEARTFLTETFAKTELVDDTHDLLAASRPKEAVALGATWKPDAAPFATAFEYATVFDLRNDKTTVACKLESVEKKGDAVSASFSSTISHSLETVTNAGMPIPLDDTSKVTIQQKHTTPLSGRLRLTQRSTSFEATGAGDFQGMAFEYTGSASDKVTLKAGGKIPEPATETKKDDAGGGVPQDPGAGGK